MVKRGKLWEKEGSCGKKREAVGKKKEAEGKRGKKEGKRGKKRQGEIRGIMDFSDLHYSLMILARQKCSCSILKINL